MSKRRSSYTLSRSSYPEQDDKRPRRSYVKIFIVLIILGVFLGGLWVGTHIPQQQQVVVINNTPAIEATPVSTPAPVVKKSTLNELSPEVQAKFEEIYHMPYVLDLGPTKSVSEFYQLGYGDCDDKSNAFASYLVDQGVTNVNIVHSSGKSSGIGHAYVSWNGYAYDEVDASYHIPDAQYEKELREEGFTTFRREMYS
jgi:hypothetical protein